jgi:AraC-like DNA-binding protein
MMGDSDRYPRGGRQIADPSRIAVGSESPAADVLDDAATIRYASADLAQRRRVSACREHLSAFLIEVELEPDGPPSRFDSVILMRPFHDLQLLKMMFTAARIVRVAKDEKSSSYFVMHINFDGVVAVSSMGRQLTLNKGEAVLLDAAHPFTIHRQRNGSSYVVRIPRERMAHLACSIETIVMRRLPNSGSLNLFTTYLDAILRRADRATPKVRQRAYGYVTDLLAVLLNSGDVPETETEPAKSVAVVSDWTPGISDVRLQAAKSYIIERAHDQISLGQVAKHLGIPERRLQRLFGSRGITFTAFLKDVRLARVYDMLCDPDSDGQRIRSICFAAGFRDISHFNRLFRARYGCTPAEVRASRREDTSR